MVFRGITRNWETGGRGSWPETLGTRNVKPPEDRPHEMRTQFQSNARLEQTEAEDLALLTTMGVTVPPRWLKFG